MAARTGSGHEESPMSDEDGIRRTIAKYCQLFDAKKWDELAEIFAGDSSVTSRRGTFQGRANVIRDLQNAMTGDYHGTLFTANSWITVEGDTASAVSDFLEVEDTQIVATGRYRDTFIRSGDSWLLASKEIRLK
jgi:ketosteroid isomerase-like protein